MASRGASSLCAVNPDRLSIVDSDGVGGEVVGHVGSNGHAVSICIRHPSFNNQKWEKDRQSRVETAILQATRVGERGLGCSMVLLLEVEDDLVTGVSELERGKRLRTLATEIK